MKITSVDLERVLGVKSELPKTGKPEFVMAGRSNVGKSSFINAFVNRKNFRQHHLREMNRVENPIYGCS